MEPASQDQDSPSPLMIWRSPLFWQWVGLNSVLFGGLTAFCFSPFLLENLGLGFLGIVGLIIGSSTGLVQPIILRKKIPKLRTWAWILGNIIGGYVGIWSAIYVLLYLDGAFLGSGFLLVQISLVIYGGMIGLGLAIPQMIILAAHHCFGVKKWAIATVLGRAIAWWSGCTAMTLLFGDDILTNLFSGVSLGATFLGGLIGGFFYGVTTGLVFPFLTTEPSKA